MADVPRRLLLGAPLLMAAAPAPDPSVFDISLPALEGGTLSLADYRERVLLVVNTASFCGYTRQYAGLQTLHDRYEARGFAVIGVPSNDFNQESADNRAVRRFCDTMYGIAFPLAAVSAVRGPNANPLHAWLAARAGGAPRWNFHKYLVGRDGRSVRAFPTSTEPDAPVLTRAIEAALAGHPLA